MNFIEQTKNRRLRKRTRKMIVQMDEFRGPCRGYKAIRATLLGSKDPIVTFGNQTLIPNSLKFIEERRKMVLVLVHNPTKLAQAEKATVSPQTDKKAPEEGLQYPFKDVLGHELDTDTYVHITLATEGEIYYYRGELYGHELIKDGHSYLIPQQETIGTKFGIRVKGKAMFALDVTDKLPTEHFQPILTPLEKYDFTPPEAVKNHKCSFLRKEMGQEEIHKKLVFIDIECAYDADFQPIPISLAAVNYLGTPLVDAKICPRRHITEYKPKIHGLTDQHLVGKEDGIDAVNKFKALLRNRIVVGHDLHLELTALNIDLSTIAGVRDIQHSAALRQRMILKTGEDKLSWKLSEVTHYIEAEHQQKGVHSAIGDARAIRDVYISLEQEWSDTPKEIINRLVTKARREKTVTPSMEATSTPTEIPKNATTDCLRRAHEVFKAELLEKRKVEEARKRKEEKEQKERERQTPQQNITPTNIPVFELPPFPPQYLSIQVQNNIRQVNVLQKDGTPQISSNPSSNSVDNNVPISNNEQPGTSTNTSTNNNVTNENTPPNNDSPDVEEPERFYEAMDNPEEFGVIDLSLGDAEMEEENTSQRNTPAKETVKHIRVSINAGALGHFSGVLKRGRLE